MSDLAELRALAERYGVPGVDLGAVVIRIEDLELIPREVCEKHRILPVVARGEQLFLAMANPADTRVIDEIEFVTGKKVYPYAALSSELARTLDAAHDARARHAAYYVGANVPASRREELGVDAKGMPKAPVASRRGSVPSPPPVPGVPVPVPVPVPDKRAVVSPVIPLPTASADPRREPDDDSGVNDERRSSMPPANSRGSAGRPSSAPSKLILVVDDEEEIRVMLKRVLVARSHRVIEADTGSLALSMVKQHIPDLVILDAMLPGLHGFDVARRLRASDRYGAIPIIMISAVYRGWRVKEDLRASYGIFDYLEKPFRLADVLEAAERALSAKTSESPGPDPDTLSASAAKALEEGIAAYRAGDIDRAIQLLAKGTELDPLAFRLHFHLALLYGKKDQVFDGIRQLELAVELSPKHFAALKNLALLYERAGFKNRAIEVWERAVHAAPDPVSKAQVKERLVALL